MKTLSCVFLAAAVLASGCVSAETTTRVQKEIARTNATLDPTPLATAARSGDKALVEKLLSEGVVPGEGAGRNYLGDGISMAESYKHSDIVQLLVAKCREVYMPGQNCPGLPCWAAMKGDTILLAEVLSKGPPQCDTCNESTLLTCAALEGNIPNAKFLIKHGDDIDSAIASLEKNIATYSASDTLRPFAARFSAAIRVLERLRTGGQTPTVPAAGSGITKAEMEQIVKSAVAATKAPSAPAEIKSDVDQPAYNVAANPDAFAVVVGVEKYNSLPDARFAARDATAMNAHLLAMGYPQRNIVLLTGHQATRTGLVKNLEAWLPNQVTERSTVMFYFSGHGAPDAKTSAAYLVPTDGDPQYLEETAYPIKRLYEKLGALRAKRVLVALDSCFSGAGGRSVIASGTRPLVAKLNIAPTEAKVVSLSASSAEEITGALEDQGHGLFTYHLLKALSETAGRGTVSELHAALTPRVQDEARRQNRSQTPQMFGASVDGGLR